MRYGRHDIWGYIEVSDENTPGEGPSAKASPAPQRPLAKTESWIRDLLRNWEHQPTCNGVWIPLGQDETGPPVGDSETGSAVGCLCWWGCRACDGSVDLYNKLHDRPWSWQMLLGSGECKCQDQPGPMTGCPRGK
jgi:hypothetical protein